MRHLLAPAALSLLAAPVLAQNPGIPGSGDTARVVAGTYAVDPAHTQVRWRVNHLGFSQFDGFFADPEGTLTIDPKRMAATQLRITLPIGRVVTTSPALDRHLKSADFFDAAKYPTATFVSTQVQATGSRARITGTDHGQSDAAWRDQARRARRALRGRGQQSARQKSAEHRVRGDDADQPQRFRDDVRRACGRRCGRAVDQRRVREVVMQA